MAIFVLFSCGKSNVIGSVELDTIPIQSETVALFTEATSRLYNCLFTSIASVGAGGNAGRGDE
jgi:hypothetical protein